MKILMTTDTVGGVWTYAVELCRALCAHQARVHLATMGAPLSFEQRRQLDSMPHVHVHPSDYRLCWMDEPWRDVERARQWLLALERRHRPDVVHLNDLGQAAAPFGSPVLLMVHSCVLSWWQAVRGGSLPDEWQRYRDEVTRGMLQATWVAAPSRHMLERARANYGRSERTRVLANGCSSPGLAAPPETHHGDKEPFILVAGRLWDEAKNAAAVEQIVPELDWPVCFAGEQRTPTVMTSRDGKARYLGRLGARQMAAVQQRAAIFASPARYEPFGLAILEAARSGCCLVLGDIPSLRELWGDAAVYVDPERPDQLRDQLNSLIREPRRRRDLAHQAWLKSQSYSAGRMAFETYELYEQMLADAGPERCAAAASSGRLLTRDSREVERTPALRAASETAKR